MAFEYFPAAAERPVSTPAPKPNWLLLTAVSLFLALCMAIGYIIWDKNKTIADLKATKNESPVVSQQASPSIEKDSLQKQLLEATSRYTVLREMNMAATGMISEKDKEIAAKSDEINRLLQKSTATISEMQQAKSLINALNADIDALKTEVGSLQKEKTVLQDEKDAATARSLSAEKRIDSAITVIRQKDDIIDLATTLYATGFSIISIHEKNNGREKTTGIARKVDKLRISFGIGENRVASSGKTELFICITGPDGTPISVEALGSGKFSTKNGEQKFYTEKIDINYVQGSPQTVSFDWRQNSLFEPGMYKIEVYNNGLRIGSGIRYLK